MTILGQHLDAQSNFWASLGQSGYPGATSCTCGATSGQPGQDLSGLGWYLDAAVQDLGSPCNIWTAAATSGQPLGYVWRGYGRLCILWGHGDTGTFHRDGPAMPTPVWVEAFTTPGAAKYVEFIYAKCILLCRKPLGKAAAAIPKMHLQPHNWALL